MTAGITREFAKLLDALRWLNTPPLPAPRTRVRVAGTEFTVWRQSDGTLLLLRSSDVEALDAMPDEEG